MTNKVTLVLGASSNTERYSYKAVQSLLRHKHKVFAVGLKPDLIFDVPISISIPEIEELDTISLYLGPKNQIPYYDEIIKMRPKRVIFNPGAENSELEDLLKTNSIAFEESCTLVLLATGQF